MKFKDWFDTKLIVGAYPFLIANEFNPSEYDYVINVSDEYHHSYTTTLLISGCRYFWFPMNERKRDVGLNSLYASMIILHIAEKENKRVYLHCHSGKNRSQSIRAAYYFMRTNMQLETNNSDYGYSNRFLAMCGRGYLPPKAESEKFLQLLADRIDSAADFEGLLDSIKIDSINNF